MDKFILKKIFNDAPKDGNYIAICSTIAGYHEFLVRPLAGSRFHLGLRLEKTNVYHNNAILVLSATSDKYSPSVVEQCKGRDIFNKKTGRVPRQLADILAPQLESGKLIWVWHFTQIRSSTMVGNQVEVHTYAASIC